MTFADGDGYITGQNYDDDGRITSSYNGAGYTTLQLYDHAGNLTATVAPGGHTTSNQYDSAGNETASIDSDGTGTTAYGYDLANLLTSEEDPDGNVTSYTLDGDGNATIMAAPAGNTRLQSFDGDGNLTQVITGDGNTINSTYDGDGNTLTNGYGTFGYDSDGNMTSASNANGAYTLSYNGSDQLTQAVMTPFGTTLNYGYDLNGNQTLVTDSFGGTESSTYDADNYLIERTYQGQSEQLRFDFANNEEGWPTMITSYSNLAGTSLVATSDYGYNGDGQITSIQNYNATSTLIDAFADHYDSSDNVTQQIPARERSNRRSQRESKASGAA